MNGMYYLQSRLEACSQPTCVSSQTRWSKCIGCKRCLICWKWRQIMFWKKQVQEQKRHCKCRDSENFSGQEHFRQRVHSTTSMAGKAEKCKLNDKLSAARFRLGYWCFCDPGSDLEIQRRATISPFCWRWMTVSWAWWENLPANTQCSSVRIFFKQVYL